MFGGGSHRGGLAALRFVVVVIIAIVWRDLDVQPFELDVRNVSPPQTDQVGLHGELPDGDQRRNIGAALVANPEAGAFGPHPWKYRQRQAVELDVRIEAFFQCGNDPGPQAIRGKWQPEEHS